MRLFSFLLISAVLIVSNADAAREPDTVTIADRTIIFVKCVDLEDRPREWIDVDTIVGTEDQTNLTWQKFVEFLKENTPADHSLWLNLSEPIVGYRYENEQEGQINSFSQPLYRLSPAIFKSVVDNSRRNNGVYELQVLVIPAE